MFNAEPSYISYMKTELMDAEAVLRLGQVCLQRGSRGQTLGSRSVSPELVPTQEGLVSNQRHIHHL